MDERHCIMQKDLNKKIGYATKWSTITELGTKLISPITNAILARLLAPEVFGVVATLTLITSFAEIFTDAGFQKYLVQHEFDNEEDLNLSTDIAFWVNLLFSIIVWVGISLFADPIAEIVGSSGYESSIIIMCAEIPLLGFSSIQIARFRRDFAFKSLFVVRMILALVPLVITVPAAIVFRSHWALVIGVLAKDVLSGIVLMVRSKWKPRFRFSFNKLKDMISFSFWTVLESVTIWFTTNAGTFIVGSLLGTYYLGLYKTTITTIGGYFAIIQSATMPVLFSALSRCQENEQEFCGIVFRFQPLVALLVFPLGFGIFVYRDFVTLILLGRQWMEVADFLGIYALSCSMVFIFSYYNSEIFRSKGKPKFSMIAQIVYFIFLVPALYYSTYSSFEMLCFTSTMSRIVLIIATSTIAHFSFHIKFGSVIKNVLPSLVSSMIMAIFGYIISNLFVNIIWEIFTIMLCVIVYFLCVFIMPAGRKQIMEIPILKKFLIRLYNFENM